MADFDIGSFMKDIVSGLATLSESVQVIGQPVEVGGKVVIPAVVTRMGFGAGGGAGTAPCDDVEEGEESGSGGGGGGGVTMTPVFLVVDDDGERLLTVGGPFQRACSAVEQAKRALDKVMPRKDPCEDEIDIEEELQDLEDESPGEGPAH
ncbi:MAG: spore germination protein GerW family protein [Armatimonadota bacterium]